MICESCKKTYVDEYNYCPFCGQKSASFSLQLITQKETLQHPKIEYRYEKIDLDLDWKTHQLSFIELESLYSIIPGELKKKANQLISIRINELGALGWEPTEGFFDIDNLKVRPTSKLIYESRGSFFGRKNHIHAIVVSFKRVSV